MGGDLYLNLVFSFVAGNASGDAPVEPTVHLGYASSGLMVDASIIMRNCHSDETYFT